MSRWTIDKFWCGEYGHRVWSQQLNESFCAEGDTKTACRHLHGHSGKAHIYLEGETLERGMVTDFKHVGAIFDFLDEIVDHKFIIDRNDPIYPHLVGESTKLLPLQMPGTDFVAGYEVDMPSFRSGNPAIYEMFEGLTVVDFVPTSENLCKWVFEIATAKMSQLGVKVVRVDWHETMKSRASYSV